MRGRDAEWRLLRGWNEEELAHRLDALTSRERNFTGTHEAHLADPAWETYGSRATLATVEDGPPAADGPFARGRAALESYAFSDPSIVEAHFERDAALEGRRMLLELKVLGLHYLCGVVVGAVRREGGEGRSVFGFRYDTLEGHIEAGSEWFVLEKEHATGALTFTIEATWRPGDFPNVWSRWGFAVLGRRYQRRWHRRAHHRMALLVGGTDPGALAGRPRGRRLAHGGPEVVFTGGASR